MAPQIRRLGLALFAVFAALALTAGYWALAAQAELLARPDNPRARLSERRFPRGAIVDRRLQVLAESRGLPGALTRYYPYPDLAPVLGYVSPIYGLGGVEAAEDEWLHGPPPAAWWEAVAGTRPAGRNVMLTLDLRLQTAADQALRAGAPAGDRAGAAVVLDAQTGAVLALASHPTFDPNALEDNWADLITDTRAPLLNRATVGLYQPGGTLQPFMLAAALQSGLVDVRTPYVLAGDPFQTGALTLRCRTDPGYTALTLAEAFVHGCPQPFAALGEQLGARRLTQLFNDLRLLTAFDLGLPTAAAAPPDYAAELAALGAGQGTHTLTPLHLAIATAAIARDGVLPFPHLIRAVQEADGAWVAEHAAQTSVAAFAPEAADQVKALMPNGHSALALSGEGRAVAWYTGFAPEADPRYTVAVLLEDGDLASAAAIGQALLAAAVGLP